MKRWLTEPLVHFVVIGFLIFVLYARMTPVLDPEGTIVISSGQQEHLVTAFSRTWRRSPTPEEFNRLVDDQIREEIAYREAQKMGLDTGDTIIRRRLRQKVELLAEDVVGLIEPSDEQLQAFLDDHQNDYLEEPRATFEQIYFSLDRRGDEAMLDAEQALLLLETDGPLIQHDSMGDALPLPTRFEDERLSDIAGVLGKTFSVALEGLEPGRWHGPVQSGFGLHLVYVHQMVPGRPLTLVEIRNEVYRDWSNAQRIATVDGLYERLRSQYTITVEPMAGSGAAQ